MAGGSKGDQDLLCMVLKEILVDGIQASDLVGCFPSMCSPHIVVQICLSYHTLKKVSHHHMIYSG